MSHSHLSLVVPSGKKLLGFFSLSLFLFFNPPCVSLSTNKSDKKFASHNSVRRQVEVFNTIKELEMTVKISDGCGMYDEMTHNVIEILKEWTVEHSNDGCWQSLLNKRNLRHEVEESIVALYHLKEWARKRNSTHPFIAVDVCCGKGVFSMLLSYLSLKHVELSGLTRIILLDNDSTIDWAHIRAANVTKHRAEKNEGNRPIMDLWAGINLHSYDSEIVTALQSYNQPVALTGIHLCKTLGPSFVSLVNALGAKQAPYVCLAPCCLPRLSSKIMIDKYEGTLQRNMRLKAKQQQLASRERRRSRCFVCQGRHHVKNCPQKVQFDSASWDSKVENAILNQPCWNCGKVGHRSADCKVEKVKQIEQPAELMSLSNVAASNSPFESYCDLLSTFIQDTINLDIIDSGLVSLKNHSCSNSQKRNWNRHRKNIFIVASR